MATLEERKTYRAEIKNKDSKEIEALLNERERYVEWKREILIEKKSELDDEKMLACAKKANELAERAQQKALWANRYACISVMISIIALIVNFI